MKHNTKIFIEFLSYIILLFIGLISIVYAIIIIIVLQLFGDWSNLISLIIFLIVFIGMFFISIFEVKE